MISFWVVELSDCLAKNICLSFFIQKRNEISPWQGPELFHCLAENIRLSWPIQNRNKYSSATTSSDRWWRLLMKTIFVPTEDWTSNIYTPNQSLFGKHKFYQLKYINAYVDTEHACEFEACKGPLTLPPCSSSPVN